jgi:uncharacterized protein involved in exopolysaccharide biosynthesis
MNNHQLYLSIGIPSILIILAWISNRSNITALRSEMAQLRRDIALDMTQLRKDLHSDMEQLRKDLHGDMTQLRDSIHRDIISLYERVAVVETRQQPN